MANHKNKLRLSDQELKAIEELRFLSSLVEGNIPGCMSGRFRRRSASNMPGLVLGSRLYRGRYR